MIESIDKATKAATPDYGEKLITIKAIQDCRNDPALPHTVGEREHVGEQSSLEKFVKQETVFNKIKGPGNVHTAPKDI